MGKTVKYTSRNIMTICYKIGMLETKIVEKLKLAKKLIWSKILFPYLGPGGDPYYGVTFRGLATNIKNYSLWVLPTISILGVQVERKKGYKVCRTSGPHESHFRVDTCSTQLKIGFGRFSLNTNFSLNYKNVVISYHVSYVIIFQRYCGDSSKILPRYCKKYSRYCKGIA